MSSLSLSLNRNIEMRKKVDERIRTLIENGVKTRHRSMFVIVGDRYHDQVNMLFSLGNDDHPFGFVI